ncbi:hypothetical protein SAMN04488498_13227 [Mesorhizobium albiziae]|uniref:Uncharacterized protein n=1 Tax=Neomesorhizobium albiziae TaxID=335020 RepID=A0A1I4EZI6_9HYPH|nr:hypothetical protein GCM10007937_24070 [Mesorhizobium albiziae]SFL10490.1 hypothetical protein SAMN04488498_13227 [Mesorhizobium albiziae]
MLGTGPHRRFISCLATKTRFQSQVAIGTVFPKDFFKAFLRESETLGEENGRDGTPAPAL